MGSQVYLSYNHLSKYNNNSANSTEYLNATATRRMLMSITQTLTSVTDGVAPLVFYGTAFSFMVKYLCNFLFCVFFLMIMRHDECYKEWV